MNEKVKELKKAEKLKKNLRHGVGISSANPTSISSSNSSNLMASKDFSSSGNGASAISSQKSTYGGVSSKAPVGGGKALKLGSKATTEDVFLQQLRNEGQNIATESSSRAVSNTEIPSNHGPVNFKCIEKLSAVISRSGALENCEILGSISLHVTDAKYNTVATRIHNKMQNNTVQLQVHPNLDKKIWQNSSTLQLKSEQKPFPTNVDVGVLKWRLQLSDIEAIPLVLNYWPEEIDNECRVSVEYTLQEENFEFDNVVITIPLPPATVPVVAECEGAYEYQKSKSQLVWTIALIDQINKSGSLEFTTPNGHSDHFYPVHINFSSSSLFCNLAVRMLFKIF